METGENEKCDQVPKSDGNTRSEQTEKWKGLFLVFGATIILFFFIWVCITQIYCELNTLLLQIWNW